MLGGIVPRKQSSVSITIKDDEEEDKYNKQSAIRFAFSIGKRLQAALFLNFPLSPL